MAQTARVVGPAQSGCFRSVIPPHLLATNASSDIQGSCGTGWDAPRSMARAHGPGTSPTHIALRACYEMSGTDC
eukprot:1146482-Rhodomonas_salina.1